MTNYNDQLSGIVGGTPDGSSHLEVQSNGPTAVDTVTDHRKQVRHRIEALERLALAKALPKAR